MKKEKKKNSKTFVYLDPDLKSAIARDQKADPRFANRSQFITHLIQLGYKEYDKGVNNG